MDQPWIVPALLFAIALGVGVLVDRISDVVWLLKRIEAHLDRSEGRMP